MTHGSKTLAATHFLLTLHNLFQEVLCCEASGFVKSVHSMLLKAKLTNVTLYRPINFAHNVYQNFTRPQLHIMCTMRNCDLDSVSHKCLGKQREHDLLNPQTHKHLA